MATVAILRTRNGVPESADSALLVVRNAVNFAVWGGGIVPPTSPGQYQQVIQLGAGTYTAEWTFSNTGYPDDQINRLFTLDPPAVMSDGVTLMAV